VTGHLCYIHADGGIWIVRYAPLGTEDANGGSVKLDQGMPMHHYREGDLVTVQGEIASRERSRYTGAPLYRAHSIRLLERKATAERDKVTR
jgi:hypothetical protein